MTTDFLFLTSSSLSLASVLDGLELTIGFFSNFLFSVVLIYKMAQGFYGAEKEDIVQAGFLGLTKAYKKYNPDSISISSVLSLLDRFNSVLSTLTTDDREFKIEMNRL